MDSSRQPPPHQLSKQDLEHATVGTQIEKCETNRNVSLISDDTFLVEFDQPYDSQNPKDWPSSKKWAVTSVMSVTGFNRIMVSTIMAPALPTIARDFHTTDTQAVMTLSVYLLATAFGPLAIGPLSEVYGREPVLHATNIWFLIWNLVCGFANNKSILLAARLLAGLGASAIYALGSGVLGDVWRPEQRGRSLALYLLIPLLAAAVGPILGGIITQRTTWRWMFWSTSCLQAVMIAASLFVFHETHAPTILGRRAKSLRQTTGDNRYHTADEKLDDGRSPWMILRNSLSRPIRLLIFHPIVQVQAVLCAFNYGITYFLISTYSTLWMNKYHESLETSGFHYFAMCLGDLCAAQVAGPLMDWLFAKLKKRADGESTPEYRLPLMLPGAILAPIGFLMYGWAAEKHVFWFVVDLGAFVVTFGTQFVGAALQAYVIDSYPNHTSSASAANQFFRSLTAFGFPLFAPTMFARLGYGWANTILALTYGIVALPAPVLLWRYGSRLRAKAQSSH